MAAGQSTPVSVIVPALNEERYIDRCLDGLLQQQECDIIEVIVVDGGSTDQTLALVKARMQRTPTIKLLHNPRRLQSAAINLAVAHADERAQVFVRADAHMVYAPDFVRHCVQALCANVATSVVVAMQTVGKTGFQRAVAAAQNSLMGNGGSAHRSSRAASGWVDHGHHAAFDRAFFTRLGGYDATFHPNDDFEFDYRARRAGGHIWLAAEARLSYFPRDTPLALARQYRGYGRARALTHIAHRLRPRLRQVLPAFILLMVIGGFALSLAWWPFALLPLAYLAICLLLGVVLAVQRRDLWLLAAGPAVIIMHLSYGVGCWQTVLGKLLSR